MNTQSNENTQTRPLRQTRRYFDYSLLFIVIFLLCFGLVMLYSTSSYSAQLKFGNDSWYLNKQILATAIGLVVMFFFIIVDYHFWANFAFIGYFVALLLIILVLTPLGFEANGARRWIDLKIISFQPAEVAKLAIILFFAVVIGRSAKAAHKFSYIVKMMMSSMPMVLCILFITKNMSSALILLAITGIMIFVVSPKFLHFVYIVLGGVAALVTLIFSSGGFRLERFQVWLNPELYSEDGGYQVLQGLYAIGSGGLFGKGLGQSVQKKGFVPEAQNDMIFAIICEELGLVGAICVICMFIFLIWRLMIIASNAPDLFGSLLVVGIMAHISVQVVLNIAVVTAVVPNTGITLPFISYGGSSILFLLAEMGIALNISRQIKGT